MTQVTSPDNIVKWTNSDPASISVASQAQGDSVQAAFSNRERYSFVWANSGERTAQTGMVQGSQGYQVDTKTDYIYDNSVWRLQLSHAEFTGSKTFGHQTLSLLGVMTQDPAFTTNTTFATAGTDGIIILVDPGLYAISTVSAMRNTADTTTAPAVGRTFLDLSFVSGAGDLMRVSIAIGEDRGSLAQPNVRTTTANQNIYFQGFHANGVGVNVLFKTRVKITRIG